MLSLASRVPTEREWIRCPFYHHVFDDERKGFETQLRYMRNYGDFISISDAVEMLGNCRSIGGRYFCISFDDGFKSCATNALPILLEHRCSAAFFLATDYIGCKLDHDFEAAERFFRRTIYPQGIAIEFMDWDDCRKLVQEGMTIGAHTCSHVRLSSLDTGSVQRELMNSKQKIEEELGTECLHFAAPWGKPGQDIDLVLHRDKVREVGFRSLLTTERGANEKLGDVFSIRRDFLLAGWRTYQLRYLFGR